MGQAICFSAAIGKRPLFLLGPLLVRAPVPFVKAFWRQHCARHLWPAQARAASLLAGIDIAPMNLVEAGAWIVANK